MLEKGKKEENTHDCAIEPWLPHSKEIGKVALLPATLPDSTLNMNIREKKRKKKNEWDKT